MKKIFFATSALMLTLTTGTTFAAEKPADLAKQIQMLQQQLQSMQQQLDAVKANEAAQTEAIAKEAMAREEAVKKAREANLEAGGKNVFEGGSIRMIPPANPKIVESATHRFTLSSADGNWTIAPTGRVHFDMGGYLSQKPEGTTGIGTPAGGKMTGGVNVRRGRFGVTGKAMGDFSYQFILDGGGATDNATLINTAMLSYTGIKNTSLDIGYFSAYFSLDRSASSNDVMFLERATPVNVADGIVGGTARSQVGFRTWDKNYWFGAYLVGSSVGQAHALTQRTLGAYQRATYNPIQTDLLSVHIGGTAGQLFKAPNSGPGTAQTITLSDRPELRVDPSTPLSTGALGTVANPVTGSSVYGVESAVAWGNLFYQGEYFWVNVERRGRPSVNFDGGYAQVSYTFGGRRTYSANSGAYSGVNPVEPFSPNKGGMGAFEIAARISQMDLTDRFTSSLTAAAQPGFVNGGRQTSYTAGLNWYWNSNMLWKLNYIHTNLDKMNPTATVGGAGTLGGLKLNALAARFQVMF
ncbi:MAG: OprO/OprP family phosphate-selective porin [Rhodospirillaceae bacterium]|nr:OprO/OprP family phosphate-selective porin [Rhodospirillaceae bacterium]